MDACPADSGVVKILIFLDLAKNFSFLDGHYLALSFMLSEIISKAYELGFIAIGFSPLKRPLFIEEFRSWLKSGKNASMLWLERNVDIREDPSKLLDQCKTIISLAYPYPSKIPATTDGFTVSRYTRPDKEDYHKTIKDLCEELVNVIKSSYRDSKARICVDSAPILERSFGYSSGIGFIGKNNMLIIPEYGSYFYLAEILTSSRLNISATKVIGNQCGDCSLCVDSCPTGALESPFHLDPSRCLSYLTIECKDGLERSWGKYMGGCFVGCDICQEVCPFNKGEKGRNICLPSTDELLGMSNEAFKRLFGKTALLRPGLLRIKENIKILKNI